MRDDDVLVATRSFSCSLGRFKQVHEWIRACPQMIHCPGIIVEGGPNGAKGLEDFPEAIEYIREETRAGRMAPELHAWFHIDYAKLSFRDVYDQLGEGIEWMLGNLAVLPTRWYTPWGADNEMLRLAAKAQGLELVGVDKHWKLDRTLNRLKEGDYPTHNPRFHLDGEEISFHWWEGGARVARLCAVVRHGSWEAAEKAERELFR